MKPPPVTLLANKREVRKTTLQTPGTLRVSGGVVRAHLGLRVRRGDNHAEGWGF